MYLWLLSLKLYNAFITRSSTPANILSLMRPRFHLTISHQRAYSFVTDQTHNQYIQHSRPVSMAKGTILSSIFNYYAFERSSSFDFQPIRLAGRWFTLSQSEAVDKHLLFQILIIIICFFISSPQTLYLHLSANCDPLLTSGIDHHERMNQRRANSRDRDWMNEWANEELFKLKSRK